MPGDDRNGQFDDLFEPFELSEKPTSEQLAQSEADATSERIDQQPTAPDHGEGAGQGVTQQHVQPSGQPENSIRCPTCGAQNPAFNHHCERCGSRLSQDPMPIASAPASRSSAGGRALGVLAAVVLVVALGALMLNIFRGESSDVAGPDTSSSSTTTTQPIVVSELTAVSAVASSQLSESFSPDNLIDGDSNTRWNDNSLRGVGAWIEFTFATPVQITEIVIQNVTDEEAFRRNFKIQGYIVTIDDLNVPISGRLANSNEPQTVKIASLQTIVLRIDVTTTHPAEPYEDKPGFTELALESVRFFGVEK